MTTLMTAPEEERSSASQLSVRKRGKTRSLGAGSSLLARGEPMIWFCGGALAISAFMVLGLLALVFYQGLITFWPSQLLEITSENGETILGEISRDDLFEPGDAMFASMPEEKATELRTLAAANDGMLKRRLMRTGNFDLDGTHFHWVNEFEVVEQNAPDWAMLVERMAWGRFYGYPKAFMLDGEIAASEPQAIWDLYNLYHDEVRERFEVRRGLETHEIGDVNRALEEARLEQLTTKIEHGLQSPEYAEATAEYQKTESWVNEEFDRIRQEIKELNDTNDRFKIVLTTASGKEATIGLADIVRAFPSNRLSTWEKVKIYASRWWEFLVAEPREANSEGGVFPAIFGTVTMTILMSLAVVPFGVLAALYLREYAKAGWIVSAVRIAINNLAGVPSIVFGVFGLGFFCYVVGASMDEMFFAAKLPNPTYGKGGVLWASLTLALLTLPVVIVATEEALSAVPNSMREGSYACGASKWQTIRRIVLPRAMPGIMTGMILAMARGAGEVAPLMLVGAVKLAPELPLDGLFPYLHPERSFMHLGFHIYDLGFQSQNSEAAKPMVFTTTMLLITIITVLNLAAIMLRTRLSKKFVGNQF